MLTLGPRCLYCGAAGRPWWECDCFRAKEVRDGKRAKPRVVERSGRMVIILDDEAAANNALEFERYSPSAPTIATSGEVTATTVPVSDRLAYMRDLMRRKRAAEAEAKKRGGS